MAPCARILGPRSGGQHRDGQVTQQAHADTARRPHASCLAIVASLWCSRADSDCTGDLGSRRSTEGWTVRRGKQLHRYILAMQTCIGLSSAESELNAQRRAHKATWQTGKCRQRPSCSATLQQRPPQRNGMNGLGGKLRHVQTRYLWLQGHSTMGHVALRCVAGVCSPAEAITKALTLHVKIIIEIQFSVFPFVPRTIFVNYPARKQIVFGLSFAGRNNN